MLDLAVHIQSLDDLFLSRIGNDDAKINIGFDGCARKLRLTIYPESLDLAADQKICAARRNARLGLIPDGSILYRDSTGCERALQSCRNFISYRALHDQVVCLIIQRADSLTCDGIVFPALIYERTDGYGRL